MTRPVDTSFRNDPSVPMIQWGLPVSLDEKGTFISLRDYENQRSNVIDSFQLSEEQWSKVAAKRIEMLPEYDLVSARYGLITQERAVKEVSDRTPLGLELARIEKEVVRELFRMLAMKGST